MTVKSKWYLTKKYIKLVELVCPELKGRIACDDIGAGKQADGCYVSNAANKLRNQGEYDLAMLLERIAREGL